MKKFCDSITMSDYKECPINAAITVIGGKWKIPILYSLRTGVMRFSALQRALPDVTQKMLTQQLRELEKDGLVARKVYAEVPPRVEYSVTPLAKDLEPILDQLCNWGQAYRGRCDAPRNETDKTVQSGS